MRTRTCKTSDARSHGRISGREVRRSVMTYLRHPDKRAELRPPSLKACQLRARCEEHACIGDDDEQGGRKPWLWFADAGGHDGEDYFMFEQCRQGGHSCADAVAPLAVRVLQ